MISVGEIDIDRQLDRCGKTTTFDNPIQCNRGIYLYVYSQHTLGSTTGICLARFYLFSFQNVRPLCSSNKSPAPQKKENKEVPASAAHFHYSHSSLTPINHGIRFICKSHPYQPTNLPKIYKTPNTRVLFSTSG